MRAMSAAVRAWWQRTVALKALIFVAPELPLAHTKTHFVGGIQI
jgi:hypothetical protein